MPETIGKKGALRRAGLTVAAVAAAAAAGAGAVTAVSVAVAAPDVPAAAKAAAPDTALGAVLTRVASEQGTAVPYQRFNR